MKISKRLIAVLAMGFALLTAAPAARADSTLDDVIKRGTLIVGVGLGTPPYGLTNAQMEPDGYDVNMAKLIAGELGVKVQIVDTIAANRIPVLLAGKVDIVISSFSITPERAKTIAFTNTIHVDQQVLLAPEDAAIASLKDLVGKHVGVTRATTNDTALTRLAPPGVNIQRFDDDASTSQAMLAGQVDAIVAGRALSLAIGDKNPARKLKIKFVVAEAPMSIGIRRGDPELLHWLNTTIFMLWSQGKIQALQQKWFNAVDASLPTF